MFFSEFILRMFAYGKILVDPHLRPLSLHGRGVSRRDGVKVQQPLFTRTRLKADILFTICSVMFFTNLGISQEIFSDRIKGLRVTGETQAGVPVVVVNAKSILIEFDTNDDHPADVRVKFYHCDRNWKKTATSFINDDIRNMTRTPIPYVQSPAGTQHYRWHYSIRLPGHQDVREFAYSGNYIFEIWDENAANMLARGKFFVVEDVITPSLRVTNRQATTAVHPLYMVNKVDLQFVIPEIVRRTAGTQETQFNSNGDMQEALLPFYFTTVDVYKNRELARAYRIDSNERTASTFVGGFGTRRVRFSIDNILPGNEYRRLDLRDINHYPPGRLLRHREGADVSRMLFRSPRDNNGFSTLVTGDRYADYVQVQFEYLDDSKSEENTVYVVGDFNGWQTGSGSLMNYDTSLKRFLLTTWMRRGSYDYQYVLKNDWTALEGNDWRTVNVYSAFVYYRDERYGGFDRILGVVQGRSSGQNSATDF